MIHDVNLLDRLEALTSETFSGDVFRASRPSLDPLAGSYAGGRWMTPNSGTILYTSLIRDGALAEISFHWSRATPLPRRHVSVHKLKVSTERTIRLVRADLRTLGVSESDYQSTNPHQTQAIGSALEFLGYDGLIAPSARWQCDNLMLFPDRIGALASIMCIDTETVDWVAWAEANGFLPAK